MSQTITINVKNRPISQIFDMIRQQTNHKVIYNDRFVNPAIAINVSATEMPLEDLLKKILNPLSLTYELKDNTILIGKALNMATTNKIPMPSLVYAQNQQRTITGKVTDDKGQALAGVTVRIKGVATGVVTNAQGGYSIKVINGSVVLVFSYIGYGTVERKIGDNTAVNVSMSLQKDNLNEVVVIGYGEIKKADQTGSVASVNIHDMDKAPVKSFDEALAGRVAGVAVSGNDGQPGQNNNIVIRGAGSITQDNSPLYVIDGFPMEENMGNSLNNMDIASITVLKDASATAIYGARGANGVVIITTKRGTSGPAQLAFNTYYGIQKVGKKMDLLNPYEFVKYQMEINLTEAENVYLTNGKTLESYKNIKGIDQQDYIYQTAPIQNYSIALRGGNDKTKYAISGNILDQDGIVLNSGFRRYQGRVNLDQTISNKLKAGVNINYSSSKTHGVNPAENGLNVSYSNNLFYSVWGYRPVTGKDDNSDLFGQFIDPELDGNGADYRVNPVISTKNQISNTFTDNLYANAYAEYAFFPELKLKITGGISNNMVKSENFFNSMTARGSIYNPAGVNGSVYYTNPRSWLNENTLTYNKIFKKSHTLNVVAGFTLQGLTTSRNGYYANHIPNEALGLDGLDQTTSLSAAASSSRWKLASFLSRINYGYRSKYLFTVSFRTDGSSKFKSGNQWGYFPSGAFAWNIAKEQFMKSAAVVSDAKMRISYGLVGNNRVSDFGYLTQIYLGSEAGYPYQNANTSTGAQISTLGNPNLKWETMAQTDVGLDLGLFNQRITLIVDVYKKDTHNLLLLANLPYSMGFSSALKNIGKIRNKGLEITLNTMNIVHENFKWETSFNIGFNQNNVLELTENQDELLSTVLFSQQYNSLFPYTAIVGQSVAQMRGYRWDGVYQYDDFDLNNNVYVLKSNITTNGNPRANIKPGDNKYKDLNGDLVINNDDITTIGKGIPIHAGGITNNFTYRNVDLNVFFQWSYGNDLLNANRLILEGNPSNLSHLNQFATVKERWEPDNPSNTLFRAGGQGPFAYSDRVIEDGSYIRLKTLALGYTIGKELTKKLNIKSFRFYLSAQNLITWTNYSGPDPEVSIRNSTLTPGFDYSAYPRARTFTFGADINF
ncbi:TonB-linked outer membrane protein, SusC/RagA family [bacterium A37T11]|nr:TonB-linked outer membrane protein, SusC/RagA family [bacterium A37T11]